MSEVLQYNWNEESQVFSRAAPSYDTEQVEKRKARVLERLSKSPTSKRSKDQLRKRMERAEAKRSQRLNNFKEKSKNLQEKIEMARALKSYEKENKYHFLNHMPWTSKHNEDQTVACKESYELHFRAK